MEYRDGVVVALDRLKLYFDYAHSVGSGLKLVSHAHSDHAPRRVHENTVMTPETHRLVSAIRTLVGNPRLKRINETIKIDGVKVKLVNAGHVLGSSQFLVESDMGTLLYTGDINTYDTLVSRSACPEESEVLVVESTYGSPEYSFPPREEVYAQIVKWVLECVRNNDIPAFKTYSIGNSQEVVKLINTATNVPVVTGFTVSKTSEAYSRCGVNLRFIPVGSEEGAEVLRSGECVYVDSQRRELNTGKRVRWALATGWALKYRFRSYDRAFPLSSHADFRGLVEFVQNVNPKMVYTVHGYTITLARELSRRGVAAAPLDSPSSGCILL